MNDDEPLAAADPVELVEVDQLPTGQETLCDDHAGDDQVDVDDDQAEVGHA